MPRTKRSFWKTFGRFSCPFLRMSRTKRSFWKVSLSVFANVSYKTLILEGLFVRFCECLVWNAHFGSFPCPFLRMSRTKRSFWKVSLSVFANVSCETLILEGLFVSFCECLARNAHFGRSLCQFLRMSRTKRSFWKASLPVFANVSYETLILEDAIQHMHIQRDYRKKPDSFKLIVKPRHTNMFGYKGINPKQTFKTVPLFEKLLKRVPVDTRLKRIELSSRSVVVTTVSWTKSRIRCRAAAPWDPQLVAAGSFWGFSFAAVFGEVGRKRSFKVTEKNKQQIPKRGRPWNRPALSFYWLILFFFNTAFFLRTMLWFLWDQMHVNLVVFGADVVWFLRGFYVRNRTDVRVIWSFSVCVSVGKGGLACPAFSTLHEPTPKQTPRLRRPSSKRLDNFSSKKQSSGKQKTKLKNNSYYRLCFFPLKTLNCVFFVFGPPKTTKRRPAVDLPKRSAALLHRSGDSLRRAPARATRSSDPPRRVSRPVFF